MEQLDEISLKLASAAYAGREKQQSRINAEKGSGSPAAHVVSSKAGSLYKRIGRKFGKTGQKVAHRAAVDVYKKEKKGVTMNEQFEAIGDVITLVANDQHGEASVLVNDLLGARVSDALQAHKQTIAQTLFAPSADALAEEIVQEEHESVEDFKKRGGTVKQIPAHKSYSAPKSQKIKVPFRMGKAVKEEVEQLDEMPTHKRFYAASNAGEPGV